jgi:hypothetical protein
MASTPVVPQKVNVSRLKYTNAMTTTAQTVFTANTTNANLGSKLVSLVCVNGDVAARVIRVSIASGGTNYYLGTANVAASSGLDPTGANNQVNLMNSTIMPGLPIDNDGQPYILLANGDTIQVESTTTITNNAVFVYFSAIGSDF